MRINCHAHIFNIQCILTTETIEIIVRRLRNTKVVGFAADAVEGVLESIRNEPRFLNEEDLLRLFLEKIGVSAAYKSAVKKLPQPVPALQQFGILDKLPMAALQTILDALSTHFDKKDKVGGGIFDVYQTLRVALKPNCTAVADEILGQMDPTDGLVALMMDITSTSEPDRDRILFERQLRETQEAMLQRPGRIFPFVAVNTKRESHLTVLEQAIDKMGFVGVKLYPSLGYPIASEEMADVVDFCATRNLPITMHCNHGGFSADDESVTFCDPEHWVDHLARQPDTRISFAHFGGIEGLFSDSPADTEWTDHIVQLMGEFDNVFADLSFHVDMMTDKDLEKRYFAKLRSFLATPRVGDRILFGTDSWLLRLSIGERNYWQYFEQKLTADEFRVIADVNPHRFLGIPADNGGVVGASLAKHVEVLKANRMQVGATPAAWVRAVIQEPFVVNRFPPHWTPNNMAHTVTLDLLKDQMTAAQLNAGFAVAGTLHLRELLFFTPGQPTPDIFAQNCDALALRLCRESTKRGFGLEPGVTAKEAFAAVRALIVSGEETIAVLGDVIDSLFRFAGEPQ